MKKGASAHLSRELSTAGYAVGEERFCPGLDTVDVPHSARTDSIELFITTSRNSYVDSNAVTCVGRRLVESPVGIHV